MLTQFVCTVQGSMGVTSSQAVADPFSGDMTFDRDFAALLVDGNGHATMVGRIAAGALSSTRDGGSAYQARTRRVDHE